MNDKSNQTKLKKIITLFLTFLKIGAFTFGGGYAMIPLIQHEIVENKKYLSEEDVLDIIAISESTPGPIAINSATFVGYKVAGFWGSVFSTLGVVLPSFIIILLLSYVLNAFSSVRIVKYAFFGIRAGVLALILKALWSMYSKSQKNLFSYIIIALSFLIVVIFNINVIFVIIGCAITGIVYSLIAKRRMNK